MSKQASQVKWHINNLKKKYPDSNINYTDDDNKIDVKIEDTDIRIEHKIINEEYDEHGINFINCLIYILENQILQINAEKEITEDSKE